MTAYQQCCGFSWASQVRCAWPDMHRVGLGHSRVISGHHASVHDFMNDFHTIQSHAVTSFSAFFGLSSVAELCVLTCSKSWTWQRQRTPAWGLPGTTLRSGCATATSPTEDLRLLSLAAGTGPKSAPSHALSPLQHNKVAGAPVAWLLCIGVLYDDG